MELRWRLNRDKGTPGPQQGPLGISSTYASARSVRCRPNMRGAPRGRWWKERRTTPRSSPGAHGCEHEARAEVRQAGLHQNGRAVLDPQKSSERAVRTPSKGCVLTHNSACRASFGKELHVFHTGMPPECRGRLNVLMQTTQVRLRLRLHLSNKGPKSPTAPLTDPTWYRMAASFGAINQPGLSFSA